MGIARLRYAPFVLIPFFIFLLHRRFEPHVEISFYDRQWAQHEMEPIGSLAGCFDAKQLHPDYNMTEFVYGAKTTQIHPGMSVRRGLDCYNFAGTIPKPHRSPHDTPLPASQRTVFHTYWRADLLPFLDRQEWVLKSYFATQDLHKTKLILWSNRADLAENPRIRHYLTRFPDAFGFEVVDIPTLSKGTALYDSTHLQLKDAKAWVDGDLVRLLLLWNFGGIWIDMDSLFTRDLTPLLEHEFVTQWDCYGLCSFVRSGMVLTPSADKEYVPLNGALMRFRKHSPYLCEAFHLMASSPPPREASTDWGATLYFKLFRRLIQSGVPPFGVLPFCFSDGRSCRLDNRLPDPFTEDDKSGLWTSGLTLKNGGGLDDVLENKVFGVHLHNQWEKTFPAGGWVERLLLKRFDRVMNQDAERWRQDAAS